MRRWEKGAGATKVEAKMQAKIKAKMQAKTESRLERQARSQKTDCDPVGARSFLEMLSRCRASIRCRLCYTARAPIIGQR
jgi:hypothetical protein